MRTFLNLVSSRMARLVVIGIALVVVAFMLSTFASITQQDATARLNLRDATGMGTELAPGQLYLVSENGHHVYGPLCDGGEMRGPLRSAREWTFEFRNVLGEWMPVLASITGELGASAVASDLEKSMALRSLTRLTWDVRVERFGSDGELWQTVADQLHQEQGCESDVIVTLDHQSLVCAVRQVYYDRSTGRAIALQFHDRCISYCKDQQCTAWAGAKILPEVNDAPLISRVKNWFSLIDYSHARKEVS